MHSLRTLGEIRLIGALAEPLAGRRKDLVLLCYLALRAPRPVRRAELVGLFWDERDQRHAMQSLRQVLVRLRRVIGETLVVDRETVRLADGAVSLDARAFAADVDAGRAATAVERWGGEFLQGADDVGGEAYRAWLEGERESLRRRLESAFRQLVAAAQEAGDWPEAAARAARWAELFPLSERPHRHWVDALYRARHPLEAASQHAAFTARLRRELGEESSVEFQALLRRLEAEARLASPAPAASPGSAALFTPDLVGRDGAWRELGAAWQLARRGSTATVVVEGGEGLGKTFLCERFLQDIEDSPESGGAVVLRAHGRPEHQERVWQGGGELLAPLSRAPGLGGAADAALAAVSRLVPAIRTRYPNLPATPESDRALPAAVGAVLSAVAQEVPVVLFFDDWPAADRPSAELVLSLAHHQPRGTLLLLTARPEWPGSPPILPELYQVPGVRRLKLTPLSEAELEGLLRSAVSLPPEDSHALASRLHRETGGNPFFAIEIVSAMVDEGRLAPDARGTWRVVPAAGGEALPLPSTVVDAVARRLTRLGGTAQRVAAAATTLEEPFGRSGLFRAAGLPPAEFDAGLDELVARRLLRPVQAAGADALEFMQPLIRRVAQERLGGSTRPEPSRRRARRPGARVGVGVVAITLLATAAVSFVVRAGAPSDVPVLAIGPIARAAVPSAAVAGNALGDMLATNLARVPRLRVISNARMYQSVALLGNGQGGAAAWSEAAIRAGAEELLEGSLLATPSGLRLDLRRVDLRTGEIRGGYTVSGANFFELADRATAAVAMGLGLSAGALHLADVTTSSLVAYRFYEEGLRSYARADYRGAITLFDAASAEDSSFALAAHYGLRARQAVNIPVSIEARDAVLRLADRTSDRERLLIRATWAPGMASPAVAAVAETLAIRYPTEPDGYLLLGLARSWSGDFLGAIPELRRVVTMDTLALLGSHANCRACEALYALVNAYILADSLPAAERTARQWVQLQPTSGRARHQFATALEYQDRAEAIEVRRQAVSLSPGHPYDAINPAIFHIRTGDFASADRLLTELARDAQLEVQRDALWFLTISLRNQGRLREALAAAARLEKLSHDQASGEAVTSGGHRAQVLFEMGRAREAEALFRSLAGPSGVTDYIPFTPARQRTWYLTHRAAALAALGDTLALAVLADSVEWWGSWSTYGRDQRLHLHVRGLLQVARGRPPLAVRAFERGIYSRTVGYTRTNLELAKVLLGLGRPAEAVPLLQSALRGGLEANNLYVTRTELQYLLARAWDAAGATDSAAAQYRRVLAAWRGADPQFQTRCDSIRTRLGKGEEQE